MASLTPRASGFWMDSHSYSHGGNTTSQTGEESSAVRDDEYYYEEEDEDVDEEGFVDVERRRLVNEELPVHDGRTPLDRTIDRIGMGSYQWTLLSLCGLGWMADNMWIQAIAIILPRVQQHYAVPDSYIGTLSSAMFAGMMLGAVGWGTCSDLMGRITAFNATLFFTAVFGILASFANSFPTLCVALFLLGSSVGGSMPTDGTLLLEHMPKKKQYLVTALSVFFSIGAVLSAIVALLVLPGHSCAPGTGLQGAAFACDPEENQGWKYLLGVLGTITLIMFIARMVFFRLHESPRYLVHAGRPQDAVKSLRMISLFNGSNLEVELEDVIDHHPVGVEDGKGENGNGTSVTGGGGAGTGTTDTGARSADIAGGGGSGSGSPSKSIDIPRPRATSRTIFDANDGVVPRSSSSPESGSGSPSKRGQGVRPSLVTAYAATGETPALVDSSNSTSNEGKDGAVPVPHPHSTLALSASVPGQTILGGATTGEPQSYPPPTTTSVPSAVEPTPLFPNLDVRARHHSRTSSPTPMSPTSPVSPFTPTSSILRPQLRSNSRRRHSRTNSTLSRRQSGVFERKLCWALPRFVRRPLWAWLDRVIMVLSPEWIRTTVLVWMVWGTMSLAFTMFNVYLPKLLEIGGAEGTEGVGIVGAVDTLAPVEVVVDALVRRAGDAVVHVKDAVETMAPSAKSLEESLWDVVIFTIGGCPGSILGAYLIESSLGRRWSLAWSTFITAFFCVVFALVSSPWAIRASTVGISLSATTMWAVLYGWTPEIFGTKVRGTACGIASALSRIGGMIAPILGGVLLMIDRTVPVYTSVVIFAFAGLCVLLLREEPRGKQGQRVVVH